VSPKKAKLAEAEQELARQMDKLNEKRAQLQQVTLLNGFRTFFKLLNKLNQKSTQTFT
jgi:dynein heavy chain